MNSIIIATVFIFTWIDHFDNLGIIKKLRMKLNFKPFNCLWCLSFWIGLMLSLVFLNPAYMALPLITKVLDR